MGSRAACVIAWVALSICASALSYANELTRTELIGVPINKSRILRVPVPIKRASVGNPEIADILVIGDRELYVLGKNVGTTNVTLWDRRERLIKVVDIEVSHDLATLKRKLHQMLPGQPLKVFSSQGDIILSGEVGSTPKMNSAVAVATSFLPKDSEGKPRGVVHNMAQVGGSQQVMLEVKVAEVSRTLSRRLGFDWHLFAPGSRLSIGGVSGGGTFPQALLDVPNFNPVTGAFTGTNLRRVAEASGGSFVGPFTQEFNPAALSINDTGLFASFLPGSVIFNLVIDAAKDNDLAKILAEPTLTAISGQEAKFIAGGEFPIPVAQTLGAVSIVYKEFGIGLKFLPVVLDSELISLQVNVDVSELSSVASAVVNVPTSNQSFIIPSLTRRAATTSVELRSGDTIGIAGLINSRLRESVDKFPGLGEVPVVGALFRSQAFLREETELVIFVTPRLARSINSSQARLPTDAFVEPSDVEFYLMGKLEGERPIDDLERSGRGGTEGRFGHVQ
ncbi:MAG: pilus assembly protein CpaC [Gammaproteobacteria bacterium]|jgi:pilus assembly protein CpaC